MLPVGKCKKCGNGSKGLRGISVKGADFCEKCVKDILRDYAEIVVLEDESVVDVVDLMEMDDEYVELTWEDVE